MIVVIPPNILIVYGTHTSTQQKTRQTELHKLLHYKEPELYHVQYHAEKGPLHVGVDLCPLQTEPGPGSTAQRHHKTVTILLLNLTGMTELEVAGTTITTLKGQEI